MDSDQWRKTYIYGKQYEEFVKEFISTKASLHTVLKPADFNCVDHLRPTKLEVLSDLLNRHNLTAPMKIMDMGCGLGASARYLATFGHSVVACDVLPQFTQLGEEITSLVGLSDLVKHQNKGLYDAEVEPASFDLVAMLGVIQAIPGFEPFQKLSTYVKPGGYLYLEDYILKENELDSRERTVLYSFLNMPYRKLNEYNDNFQAVGFEIIEFTDMSKTTSEFAWARAERILKNVEEGASVLEGQTLTYGVYSPQLLAHLQDYTEAELREKYPRVCEKIGTSVVFSADKLVRWAGWMLRKIN